MNLKVKKLNPAAMLPCTHVKATPASICLP